MDTQPPSAPRIGRTQLETYRGQVVRVVGKVVQHTGMSAVLETDAGQQVQIHMKANTPLVAECFGEVIGLVNDDLSVQEHQSMDFGRTFDLVSYNKMLGHSGEHPDLF